MRLMTYVYCRRLKAAGQLRAEQCASYSPTTTTGVLHRHLFEIHADMWIAACDQLKIVITAKGAQPAISLYRRHHSGTSGPANNNIPRAAFSPAAFVDAILEFIVGDDLVSSFH